MEHKITENGIKSDQSKIETVMEFSRLENVKSIKQFLGLTGYYRRFIHQFSRTSDSLTSLLPSIKNLSGE